MKVFTESIGYNGATLTCYLPQITDEIPTSKKRPAILVIPGGAYYNCSDREGEPVALAFASKGYSAFVLKYSVGEGNADFPRPLNEAEEALEMIYNSSEEWGVDKSRVAAIGFSAGGHLCAALSTMGRVKPAASILGYPCILENDKTNCKIATEMIPLDREVTGETPPTFLFGCCEDTCVQIVNSLAYINALNKAGVPFEVHIFQKGYHGFSLANSSVYATQAEIDYTAHTAVWFDMCITWLEQVFNK